MNSSKDYPFYEDNSGHKNIDYILKNKKYKNIERKMMTTKENYSWNGSNDHILDIEEDSMINSSFNIYDVNGFRNIDEINNMENTFFRNTGGERNNSEIFQDNKNVDIVQNKPTNYIIDPKTGKSIITGNDLTDNAFYQLFQTKETKKEIVEKMRMLKKKRKRRTKEEIKNDKRKNELIKPVVIPERKRGRRKKGLKINPNSGKYHSKKDNDNIIRKINTVIFKRTINWMNKSFLDDNKKFKNGKDKKNKNIFLKLNPHIINNKNKKKVRLKILDQTFKEILSSYPKSSKYKTFSAFHNKELIDKIFQENKQHFIQYILNMTFSKCLNYFNGQISDDSIIEDFKKNYNHDYDDKLIREFINKFEKIDKFLRIEYIKHKKEGNDEKSTEEYLTRIRVLCLNYKEEFEKKSERSENKNNKVEDSKDN